MPNPVNDVVRFIVNAGDTFEDGDSISNMKLQKLLYYCQGFHLASFEGAALFDEKVEAWEHGPVVPVVWRRFREFGRDPIRIRAADRPDFEEAQLKPDVECLLRIWPVLGVEAPPDDSPGAALERGVGTRARHRSA